MRTSIILMDQISGTWDISKEKVEDRAIILGWQTSVEELIGVAKEEKTSPLFKSFCTYRVSVIPSLPICAPVYRWRLRGWGRCSWVFALWSITLHQTQKLEGIKVKMPLRPLPRLPSGLHNLLESIS